MIGKVIFGCRKYNLQQEKDKDNFGIPALLLPSNP
jgi:hypothetical protein